MTRGSLVSLWSRNLPIQGRKAIPTDGDSSPILFVKGTMVIVNSYKSLTVDTLSPFISKKKVHTSRSMINTQKLGYSVKQCIPLIPILQRNEHIIQHSDVRHD